MNTVKLGGKKRNAYKILIGKPEKKRSLERTRLRCGNSIKMDLRERGWEGVDWIHLDQNRDLWRAVVNTVMNLGVP
jgi:hypothetical protein